MSERKRRFWEHRSASATFIGPESVFIGNIRGSGQFVVCGEIHGDGELQDGLNLSITGRWHGNIRARRAIIAGKITGDLIKGTVDVVWSENFTRDWEAKRVKE